MKQTTDTTAMNIEQSEQYITSIEELRAFTGVPHEHIVKKTVASIDPHIAYYLSLSSLFFLSTSDHQGRCDVSPRGDEQGFVKVLDDQRLIFPERHGNRRADSLLNILENPKVGMIFLIPGMNEVLRVNGHARITKDSKLLEQMNWTGKTMGLGIIVEVEECFIHCPRALKTGNAWQPEAWVNQEQHPSTKDMFIAHLKMNGIVL